MLLNNAFFYVRKNSSTWSLNDENNRHKSWDLKVWVLYKIITSTSLALRKNKLRKMKYDFRQVTILKVSSWL